MEVDTWLSPWGLRVSLRAGGAPIRAQRVQRAAPPRLPSLPPAARAARQPRFLPSRVILFGGTERCERLLAVISNVFFIACHVGHRDQDTLLPKDVEGTAG